MKILVTGGAGFIGSNLVDSLIALNHKVVVIDDLSSGLEFYINDKAKFYQKSLLDQDLSNIFEKEGIDFVFHLAAQIDVRKSVSDPVLDNEINVLAALNLLNNCVKYKTKKIIFSSTGGAIYGDSDVLPNKESDLTYPLSPYGIHKLCVEKYLNYYYVNQGLNYTTLRFANVYGPRQYKGGEAGVVAIFTEKAIKKEKCLMFGDGKQTRDFVFVDDVVSALMLAMDINCQGEINIGTGQETNLWQIVEAIEIALGEKLQIEVLPPKLGEQRRSVLDISRAKEVLNWQPQVDLKTGILKTINWAKNL
jgi:UDP-glucose 4-epimerase